MLCEAQRPQKNQSYRYQAVHTRIQQALVDLVVAEGMKEDQVQPLERYAFYDKIKEASLIVQSGEATAYGNALFCKAVILA